MEVGAKGSLSDELSADIHIVNLKLLGTRHKKGYAGTTATRWSQKGL